MPQDNPKSRLPAPVLLIGGLLIAVILLTLTLRRSRESANESATRKSPARPASNSSATLWPGPLRHPPSAALSGTNSAEAILARKMTQFSKKQRATVEALAKKHNLAVPDQVKRFFDAVDAGNWDEVQALFKTLQDPRTGPRDDLNIRPFWRPILDAYGAMEMAQRMPAQEYLDYGNAVLGSLKPGMVYVGGTDSGMFIPNMLNATSDGDQHIVFTQNALADSSYLDYLSYLYGDQLKTLTADQSQQAFSKYMEDAQRRYQHDQQFPDEPRQLLPGEDITVDPTGKVSISGQVAVMAINENLFQMLVQQNPDVTFAIEQSFPFKSTYAGAVPLGPIMQVGDPTSGQGLTADTAQQAVSYWQTTTQQLLANPEAAGSADTLKTYSHDAVTQAEMLAANQQPAAAEQTYNLASQLSPTNFEAIAGLSTVLYQNGQPDQAIQILNDFAQKNPTQQAAVDRQRSTLAAKAK